MCFLCGVDSQDGNTTSALCGSLAGLKATNELQDDRTGVLHQVAQHPIDQVYLYARRPCPSLPTQDLERDKVLAAEQVGLCTYLTPHLLLRKAVEMHGQ